MSPRKRLHSIFRHNGPTIVAQRAFTAAMSKSCRRDITAYQNPSVSVSSVRADRPMAHQLRLGLRTFSCPSIVNPY